MSLHFPCTWTMNFLLHNSKKLISGQCCKTRWPNWCGPTVWKSFLCTTHHSNSQPSLWTQVLHSHHCVLHESIPTFPERSNNSMTWLACNKQYEALLVSHLTLLTVAWNDYKLSSRQFKWLVQFLDPSLSAISIRLHHFQPCDLKIFNLQLQFPYLQKRLGNKHLIHVDRHGD